MLKDVIAAIDLTWWAEAGLVLFAIVFVAITIRTLLGDRARSDRNARVVLLDGPGDPADE